MKYSISWADKEGEKTKEFASDYFAKRFVRNLVLEDITQGNRAVVTTTETAREFLDRYYNMED